MRAPALMLLLAACTDYELAPKDDNNQAGQPDIVVSPSAYDLIVCGAGEGFVTVSNEGSAPLNVSNVRVEGDGWTLSGATSFTVQPGESERVPLNVAPGEATLRILSDDPDEPALAVPLHAVADGGLDELHPGAAVDVHDGGNGGAGRGRGLEVVVGLVVHQDQW